MENLLQYDELGLFEDLTFPLKMSGDVLVDFAGNPVADKIDDDEIAEKLVGKYHEIEEVSNRYELELDGSFTEKESGLMVGRIRGWTRLSSKGSPKTRQTNIAKYLVNRLNSL